MADHVSSMAKYVSKERLARAIQSLAAFGRRLEPRGAQQILPLLALKWRGANRETEVSFEEQDDFRFWDSYFLVDERSQTGRYYDPISSTWCIATHPHSNVAAARKGTFANSWRASSFELLGGRTTWRLADDYMRVVRERSLTAQGQTVLVPAMDLMVWLWRDEPFPDGTVALQLQQRFRSEFNLTVQEFTAFFEVGVEPRIAFFADEPVAPEQVRALIEDQLREQDSTAPGDGSTVAHLSLDAERVAAGLALPVGVVEQAIAALAGGSHLILAGPPGTGKSTLAEKLAEEATRAHFVSGYKTATATADWTTYDTIGGQGPAGKGDELEFQEGMVLRSIKEDSWCIIDELNRANIDRAIGVMLTLLAGSDQAAIVELPQRHTVGRGADRRVEPVRIRRDLGRQRSGWDEDSGDYMMGRNWRLIATMNTLDRSSLFPLTAAFARRFATVYVGVPQPDGVLDVLGIDSLLARDAFRVIMTEIDQLWTNPRPLGPAVVKDAWRYVGRRLAQLNGSAAVMEPHVVAEALTLYVLPQYGRLDPADWGPLRDRLAHTLAQGVPPPNQRETVEVMAQRFDAALRGIHGE